MINSNVQRILEARARWAIEISKQLDKTFPAHLAKKYERTDDKKTVEQRLKEYILENKP